MGKITEGALHKRGFQTGQDTYKEVVNFISHQKGQIKTTMWLQWKTPKMPSAGESVEYLELSHTAGEAVHWYNHF